MSDPSGQRQVEEPPVDVVADVEVKPTKKEEFQRLPPVQSAASEPTAPFKSDRLASKSPIRRSFQSRPQTGTQLDVVPKMAIRRAAAAPRMLTIEEPMAATSQPIVLEPERPAAQATIKVFYATDRKSKYGISPGDWFGIHFASMIAMVVYLITFTAVFISTKKSFYGTVAFASLVVFLVLGQSATIKWQKQKRLASNNDVSYLPEIRSSSGNTLDYGTCEITIPPDHRVGHLDSPSVFKLEFSEDPEKHVVLHRVIRTPEKEDFFSELTQTIEKSDDRQALVFIHGYNVGFEDAVKRTAQIVHDLKFDGAPICYSWSSHGTFANYTKDMANADATVVALQSFLEETAERTGNSTIHLVAHSMGNRALLQALDRIAIGQSNQESMFGQLVMAAPDVSTTEFKNRFVPSARQLARSVTLYASSRDRALLASAKIHGHNRAGMAGPNLVVMEGMDTIDVSEIDTSLIGHSYYGDHPELIKDLRALVELSTPAAGRRWLTRIIKPGSVDYFRFAELENRAANEPELRPDRR